jgi:carbamoyl-phosphate synthase large subunit
MDPNGRHSSPRLEKVSDDRIYRVKDALRLGVPEKTVHKLTKIDPWYIKQIKRLVKYEEKLMKYNVAEDIPADFFRELKQVGYSDAQIAWVLVLKKKKSPNSEKNLVSDAYLQNGRYLCCRI